MKLPFLKKAAADTTNWKIFRAVIIVGLLSAVAKAGAMGKELIVAKVFGIGDTLDAFLIAFLLPAFVLNLVMGSLGTAFIPVLVETREKQGADGAQRLFSSVLALSTAALAAVTALLGLLAPYYLPLIGSSFSAEKLRLTQELLYWILPFVLFSGLSTFLSAVLNASEKFALPAIVPLTTPVLTILLLALGGRSLGIFCLPLGLVVGSLAEVIVVSRFLRGQGLRLRLEWNGLDPRVRSVIIQYAPMLAGSFLMGGTAVIDQSMAAMLPSGGVAALNYGNRIVGTLMAIGPMTLSTAVFPYFAKLAARDDWQGCLHTLKRYLMLVTAVAVPLTFTLIAFSRPVIRLLFQRGAFTPGDTVLVSEVQACYAVQIPFYMCGMLFVRFLSSIRRNHVLMWAAALNLALDVALNLLLMRRWGIAGIALSTSLVYVFSFVFVSGVSLRFFAKKGLITVIAAQSRQAAG